MDTESPGMLSTKTKSLLTIFSFFCGPGTTLLPIDIFYQKLFDNLRVFFSPDIEQTFFSFLLQLS